MNSYIKTMIQNVSQLDKKDLEIFADRILDLSYLYKKLSSKLSDPNILTSIKWSDEDLYNLILFFEKNKLWADLDLFLNYMQDKYHIESKTIISSNDNDFLQSRLSDIQKSNLIQIKTNKIWAYIKSGDEIFSRDIDKDIDKLVRSS